MRDSYRRAKTAGEDIRLNLDEYSGQRTDQIAAEKAGFGNAETYRQAKTVRSLTPVAVAASAA